MESKTSDGDGFKHAADPNSRKSRPNRSARLLMGVSVSLGIAYAATPSPMRGIPLVMAGAPGIIGLNPIDDAVGAPRYRLITDQENGVETTEGRLRRNEESDRFTVAGPTEIDPKMIKRAEEIDPKIIHAPNRRADSRPMFIPSKPGPVPSPPMNPIPTDERLRRDR